MTARYVEWTRDVRRRFAGVVKCPVLCRPLWQVVLALSGGELLYLELVVAGSDLSRSTRLEQVGSVQLDQDIACMSIRSEVRKQAEQTCAGGEVDLQDINLSGVAGANDVSDGGHSLLHPRGKSSLLVVGLWTDNTVRLFALPSLLEVTRVSLGVDVQVRAVLLAALSGVSSSQQQTCNHSVHLLIGLGDGRVFTFLLTVGGEDEGAVGLPVLSDRQEVQLGSRPISFSLFLHEQVLCVFASCDRPTVIFSRSRHNAKLLFSPVNITDDVTQMAPFHSQFFPHCLAMTSESGLLIGTIDSLQTIHVQSYPLRESPRHICFHEDSATYVVCSTKTDMTTRGESVHDRVLFLDNKDFVTRCLFELDPNETAMSCVSMRFQTPSASSSTASAVTSAEFIVIGTAFVLPEEQQPSRGRILVFEVQSTVSVRTHGDDEGQEEEGVAGRKATLVSECVTKGAVFCLAPLLGKLVTGIDSQVKLYQFFPKGEDGAGAPSLSLLCEYTGHIMSLFCKTSGDLILVGDILRSISVLQLKQTSSASGANVYTLKEVSRDFNSNYMRAVEIFSGDHFLGAEDNGNIFVAQRPGDNAALTSSMALTEEEKSRLEVQSAFHLGDFVNVFRRGMLGVDNSGGVAVGTSTRGTSADAGAQPSVDSGVMADKGDSLGLGVSPVVLFGTVAGSLGAVFSLSADMYHFLDVLEKSLNQVIHGLGGLSHEEYRQFSHERRHGHKRRTIDGDFVEMFLDLPESQMRQVTKHLNDELHYLASQETNKGQKSGEASSGEDQKSHGPLSFTLDEVIQRLEELVRLH